MPSRAPALTEYPHGPGAALGTSEHTGDTTPSPPRLLPRMRKHKAFSIPFSWGQGFVDINKARQNVLPPFCVTKNSS